MTRREFVAAVAAVGIRPRKPPPSFGPAERKRLLYLMNRFIAAMKVGDEEHRRLLKASEGRFGI